jgi:16S rRNA processing protein RimM
VNNAAPSTAAAPAAPAMVCVGVILAAHGLRGDVKVKTYTADPAAIAAYGELTDAQGRLYRLTRARPVPGGVVAGMAGVDDRTRAEALRGTRLYVDRGRLPPPAEEEFYHADLMGMAVLDASGAEVGSVLAVHNFGAGDMLEVALAGLGSADTAMVPFSREAVPHVDVAARRLTVAVALESGAARAKAKIKDEERA